MNDIRDKKPIILVDQKKYRLGIFKRTLHMLGDPEYIQILVNPNNLTLALRSVDCADNRTHKIVWENIINKKPFELYSKELIRNLQSVCNDWKGNNSYRLFGEFISTENVVMFDLRASELCYHIQEAGNE